MKKALVIFCFLPSVLFLAIGGISLKLFLFESFQEQLAEEFCVNKEIPDMDCGGACHLSGIMTEEVDETNPEPRLPDFLKQLEQQELINEQVYEGRFCFVHCIEVSYKITRIGFLDRYPDDLPLPPPRMILFIS